MAKTYTEYTQAERKQAREMDLVSFLLRRGETVKRSGSEYEWRDGSQKVTIRGNLWFNQYERVGGDTIDFVQKYYGVDYPGAVDYLLNNRQDIPRISEPEMRQAKPFALPKRNKNNNRAINYLAKYRGISKEVIQVFMQCGMIYESIDYHNVVFVGFDDTGTPRHAHKHGTGITSSYKCTATGSLPQFSFHWNGKNNLLYLFEAPIDLLSFLTLHPEDWAQSSYASACSVSNHVLWQMLKDNPRIDTVILCLDNDNAGRRATERIAEKLSAQSVNYQILVPTRKDWNEDLLLTKIK